MRMCILSMDKQCRWVESVSLCIVLLTEFAQLDAPHHLHIEGTKSSEAVCVLVLAFIFTLSQGPSREVEMVVLIIVAPVILRA